jgi:hypothetical protein
MTALALVAEDEGSLSPARRALAEHLARLAPLEAALERASLPAKRLRDQLRIAVEQLVAAEAELAAIDAAHATSLKDQAKEGTAIELSKPPASGKVEKTIEDGRRLCANLRAALAECEADEKTALDALRPVQLQFDELIIQVLVEEANIF